MDNIVTIIIIAVAALAVGFIIAKMLEKNNAATAIASAKKEAVSIIKNAVKNGSVKIKNSAIADPELFLNTTLVTLIFIYCDSRNLSF